MTIFLTVSALVNIGLGYWLATYLAREKARAGADLPVGIIDVEAIPPHAEQPVQSASPDAMLPVAPAVAAMPTAPAIQAAPEAVVPVMATAAGEAAAAPMGTGIDAPEVETEVLAGIEEFRNQLAQMKATPDAAESVAALVSR